MAIPSRRLPLAVLLVLHGTKDRTGLSQAGELCGELALSLQEWRGIQVRMYAGFLQFAEPSAEEMLRILIRISENILVAPVMLFAGVHVKRDIPQLIDECVRRYAEQPVNIAIASPLGVRIRLAMLARQRSVAALKQAGLTELSLSEVAHVMVGAGSRDPEAIRDMEAVFTIATLISDRKFLCYFSLAKPTLQEALEQAAASGLPAVVVQPYLLFEGEMTNLLRQLLEEYRQRFPHIRWLQGDVLWPDENIVDIARYNIKIAMEQMF